MSLSQQHGDSSPASTVKSARRIARTILLLLAIPLAILWLIMAQPSLVRNSPSRQTVSPATLREHVLVLSDRRHPRSFGHAGNLNACADYIANQFKEAGAVTSFQEFRNGETTYKNVRGFFGDDAGPRIVVGAHYDSCYLTPGADDNASGVAGLIELAHLLGKTNLRTQVEVVAYSLEEPPNFGTDGMGSVHHARLLKSEGVEIASMICLEMIGYFSDRKGSQKFPIRLMRLFYPSKANFIAVIGSLGQRRLAREVRNLMRGATDLAVHSLNAPRLVPGVDFSDHMNYWNEGYDAVMITDTAFYRNANYHEQGDTPDTLDYERMSRVVIGVYEAVKSMARHISDSRDQP